MDIVLPFSVIAITPLSVFRLPFPPEAAAELQDLSTSPAPAIHGCLSFFGHQRLVRRATRIVKCCKCMYCKCTVTTFKYVECEPDRKAQEVV